MAEAASLLLAEDADEQTSDKQLQLFSGHNLPKFIDRSKPKFESTGERLFRDRSDIYEAVVELLADPGVSLRQISRHCHVHMQTIRAVAAREQIPIDAQRGVIVNTIGFGLRLAAEQVIEKLPDANVRDASVAVGILSQNWQLLNGQATARVEVHQAGNIFERFTQFHEETMKLVEARVIELETGLDGENAATKALPASEPSGGAAGDPGEPEGDRGDVVSDALPTVTEGDREVIADLPSDHGVADGSAGSPETSGTGGRGSEIFNHPPADNTGNGADDLIHKGGDPQP